MLIGIDASRAVVAAPTGTEVYSRELIRALLAVAQNDRFRLYTRGAVAREHLAPVARLGGAPPAEFDVRAIPLPRLWTHVRLSGEMLLAPPDLLFVPAHVLPPVHPRRSVVTIHDVGHLRFPTAHPANQRRYHELATRWNVRAAMHLFADSEATRDDLVELCRVPRDKISVVYPGYDMRAYRQARDAGEHARVCERFRIGRDYVLAVGTVQPRKNYVRLIEAMARIADRTVQLVIVGKRGWLCDEVFERVNALAMQARVRFLDYVPVTDMPALIRGARVFAFPSLHEGFGLPVLEAQACGTPLVCAMTSSLPEAAGDGALFIDPLDSDALAAAIERLLCDTALRSKLVANGLRNVIRFSWDKSAHQALAIFHSL